jgi:tetratricopeptide (TPR) repeat protein
MRNDLIRLAPLVLMALVLNACAARTPPALPSVLAHPEFVYPAVPAPLAASAEGVDRGWRYLQSGDLGNATREFAETLRRTPGSYPAQTGVGYVALADRDEDDALVAFDAALKLAPAYAPALVGRGQALLAGNRSADALAAFEAALAADASLVDLRRRIDVLRFRSLQDIIEGARESATAGRLDDARAAYTRAIEATPDSPFLHRELGVVERRRGDAAAALGHFRTATQLDENDAASFTQIGELLEQQRDFAGAEAAYRRAAALDPNPALRARITAIAEGARDARLPAEFTAIDATDQITRGDLAALIAVRLADVVRMAPPREVVTTDTAGHWAAAWIADVARAGVIEPFENHTFQPRTRIRRADLATAASRVITLIAASRPELRARLTERPRIADMAAGHLNYPAASVVVATGVMPLLDGGRFQVGRAVSGAEAIDVVNRLRALAAGR